MKLCPPLGADLQSACVQEAIRPPPQTLTCNCCKWAAELGAAEHAACVSMRRGGLLGEPQALWRPEWELRSRNRGGSCKSSWEEARGIGLLLLFQPLCLLKAGGLFPSFHFAHVYMCVCMCVGRCVCGCACACVWRPEADFLHCFPHCSMRQNARTSQLNAELVIMASLAGHHTPETPWLCLPSSEITVLCHTHPWKEDLNAGLCVNMGNTYSSLQHWCFLSSGSLVFQLFSLDLTNPICSLHMQFTWILDS